MQFCNRGLAYYFKGIHNLAIADQDKAIDLDPLHAVAYNNRGAAYLKLGNYAAAIADLQRAIDLKPEFPNPHKHLAWLKATCPRPEFLDGAGALAHTHALSRLPGKTRLNTRPYWRSLTRQRVTSAARWHANRAVWN